jgi:hypothetical protein
MAVLARTVNTGDIAKWGSLATIQTSLIHVVVKKMQFNTSDAFMQFNIIKPEQAYTVQ